MKKNFIVLLVVIIAIIVAWFAFSQYFFAPVQNPAQNQQNSTSTPDQTPTQVSTSTDTTSQTPLTITQDDNNKTFTVAKGSRIVIKLGEQQWTLAFNPTGIVNRIKNIMPIRGSQGVFTADNTGTTVLTAEGRPFCNPGEMCAQYIINFTAKIVVQ